MPGVDRDRIQWSANGQKVAFTEDALRLLYDSDIWVIDLEAGETRNLTDDVFSDGLFGNDDVDLSQVYVDVNPAWSPDGNQIAFARTNAAGDQRTTDILTIDLETGESSEPIRIADEPWAVWGGMHWIADDEILFGRIGVDSDDPENGIYRLHPDTGEVERVYAGDAEDMSATALLQMVNADTALIGYPQLMSRFDFDESCPLALLDLESGEATELKIDDTCVISAGVSEDGTRLLATVRGDPRIVVIDVATGEWKAVDDSAFDDVMDSDSGLFGTNREIGISIIPWTSGTTTWFGSSDGAVIRVDFVAPKDN